MDIQSLAIVPSFHNGRMEPFKNGRAAWSETMTAIVLNSVSSAHTRDAYRRALDDFFEWSAAFNVPLTKALVSGWKSKLEGQGFSAATVNQRLSAVRKLATEAADNGMLRADVAAAIHRVKGAACHGVRSGNWATRDQTQRILTTPSAETVQGIRDRALLAVLFGCGLRRAEACSLTVSHVQQRDGRWCIVDLVGKHQRVRTVPVPAWVKVALDRWTAAAAITSGRVFRAVNKGGRVWGNGITPKVARQVVVATAAAAGLVNFSAHDCRRTAAKLWNTDGGDLGQIQLLLGHASIQTTQRYLGTELNLTDAVNDRMRLVA